jgi:hypothetical protein
LEVDDEDFVVSPDLAPRRLRNRVWQSAAGIIVSIQLKGIERFLVNQVSDQCCFSALPRTMDNDCLSFEKVRGNNSAKLSGNEFICHINERGRSPLLLESKKLCR